VVVSKGYENCLLLAIKAIDKIMTGEAYGPSALASLIIPIVGSSSSFFEIV
jgi:hypothetical protein